MNCCTLYAFDGTILHKNFKKSFCNKFQYKPDAVSASSWVGVKNDNLEEQASMQGFQILF